MYLLSSVVASQHRHQVNQESSLVSKHQFHLWLVKILTHLVSQFNGWRACVRFSVSVVCVQHHPYLGFKFVYSHHRLAARKQRKVKKGGLFGGSENSMDGKASTHCKDFSRRVSEVHQLTYYNVHKGSLNKMRSTMNVKDLSISPSPGDWWNWKRQTDSSDEWIHAREIHPDNWISNDVSSNPRVWPHTQGKPDVS